jgi:hypothetical protein
MGIRQDIEFLTRFQELTNQLDDVLLFLKQEGLVDDVQIKGVKLSSDRAKDIYNLLMALKKANKFQLLEFTWTILPIEYLKIICITDRNSKEFTYGV